mgnify:CR=1 FL=1
MDKPMREVLEAMDGLRKVVRFDEMHGCDNSTRYVVSLTESMHKAGAGLEAREMADHFCEAQRQLHRATQRIIKAVEG